MKKFIEEEYKKYFVISLLAIFLVLGFLLIKPFILPLITAIFLAYISQPLKNKINMKIKKDWAVAILICLIMILIVIIPLFMGIKVLTGETLAIYKDTQNYFATEGNTLSGLSEKIKADIGIDIKLEELILSAINQIIVFGKNFLSSLPNLIMNFFIMIILLYYFVKDWDRFMDKIKKFVPINIDQKEKILDEISFVTKGVVYGTFLTALIQGGIATIGFIIFGVNSPLFFGFLLAIAALVPVTGAALVWAPISIMIIIKGVMSNNILIISKGIALFLYGLLLVSTIDNIIKPRIIGKKVHMHPVLILLGVIGGVSLFGFIGIIFGPIIFGMINILIKLYSEKDGI